MAPPDADEQNVMVDYLHDVANITRDEARSYLETFDWNVEVALNVVLSGDGEGNSASNPQQEEEPYTGPRTLDGRPAPESASSQQAGGRGGGSRPAPKKKGVATLASLSGGHAHESEDDDDDDDEDEDEKTNRGDLFAGGEKSGLAVKDPHRKSEKKEGGSRGILNDIIAKARENTQNRDEGREQPRPSRSWGSGQTVGGDGVESRAIGNPRGAATLPHQQAAAAAAAAAARPQEVQERTIHLWQDGFSIDDGPLHRFDDPANEEALRMIRMGRAPLELMNVRIDQPVDARIAPHDEAWHQLPRVYRPFGGSGRRLGSPVPGPGTTTAAAPPPATSSNPGFGAAAAVAAAPSSTASGGAGSSTSTSGVDMSQPTVMLRIQMPNGTRLAARFNPTQTIGDVYDFVTHANSDTRTREFVVATTFPNKDHTDRSAVLGEQSEFKKGGTAVVKWT